MSARDKAAAIVKDFEGLSLKPYKCPAGKWTIGYGSTGGVTKDTKPITEQEAEARLIDDLAEAEHIVESHVRVPLNENQKAALISFVYNVGPGKKGAKDGFVTLKNGKPSTMLRHLNLGDYDGAGAELDKWTKAGGRELKGLIRRRAKERALFERPVMKPLKKSNTMKAARTLVVTGAAGGTGTAILANSAETAQQNPLGFIIVAAVVCVVATVAGLVIWHLRRKDAEAYV